MASEQNTAKTGFMNRWFTDVPHNADFYSHANQTFYVKVMKEYRPPGFRPIVFLPCASTKPISKSRTHCYLSPITRDPMLERIIISEPQTVIPYSMERDCPNYDYPPGNLTAPDRLTFIRRLAFFLGRLQDLLPGLKTVHYIGGKHHLRILADANALAARLEISSAVPPRGIRDYYATAKAFRRHIGI